MSVTPETEAEVLSAFRANPQRFSPFKTASNLGIPITDVLNIVDRNKETSSVSRERNGGMGRPELQKFAVARRRGLSGQWDNTDTEVHLARRRLEAGTHIMCTGRDGAWQILYSIPRRGPPQPRPGYFNLGDV